MKTKQWIWLISTSFYSYLFYQQSAGINFMVIDLVLMGSLLLLQPRLRQHRHFWIVAVGCLLTAMHIVWHPSGMAVLLNIVSLMCLAGLSLEPRTSFLLASINGSYAVAAALLKRVFLPTKAVTAEETKTSFRVTSGTLMSWIIPAFIVALFFVLYVKASPVFSQLIQQVSLQFISPGWVIFTLTGAYLLFAFFYPVSIPHLVQWDLTTPDTLQRQRKPITTDFNLLGLKYEYRTGWILFVMLNVLLCFFNVVDIFYFIAGSLPEGVTYSAYVHQGVNTLIISIILAIAIVLYFFRGNINFLRKNHHLKYAAYLWIFQNIMLLLDTAYKNTLYIEEYGLTYKRIGVYVYLLLTMAGLMTTWIKVFKIQSNWFLFRKNAWVFYGVLIFYSFFDWSRIITRYNVENLPAEKVDYSYLIKLPATNLDMLYEVAHRPGTLHTHAFLTAVRNKVKVFIDEHSNQDWQSWNYAGWKVYRNLQAMQGQKDHK